MSKSNHPISKDYELHTTAKGEEIDVFGVPQNILRGILPYSKPKRPKVEMNLRGGKTQSRWAKEGDPEYEIWQSDIEAWEEARAALQEDVSLVLSVRKYPCNGTTILEADSDALEFPSYVLQLVYDKILIIPEHPYSKKAMWLREKALPQHEELRVGWLSQKLSGVPEEIIDQMKDSFRDIILGQGSDAVGINSQE